MLRFLTDELQAAEDAGQRVWILGHVLPGFSFIIHHSRLSCDILTITLLQAGMDLVHLLTVQFVLPDHRSFLAPCYCQRVYGACPR